MRDWDKWVREYLGLPAMANGRDRRIVAPAVALLGHSYRRSHFGEDPNV